MVELYKVIGIISLIIIIFLAANVYLKKGNDYLVHASFDYVDHQGITPYNESAIRTYDCRDIVEDQWAYPKSYDRVFNLAYELCADKFPELIEEELEKYNATFKSTTLNNTNGTLFFSNVNFSTGYEIHNNIDWIAQVTSDYQNVSINGELCEEVPCACHSNNPMCLTICYECKEIENDKNSEIMF